MTLLDELRWVRGDARAPRRWSWRQWIGGALTLVLLAGGLAVVGYVERLDPIGFGNETGPDTLAVISDGVTDTGWLLRAANSPSRATISVQNNGRLDIRILRLGDGTDSSHPISVTAVERDLTTFDAHQGWVDRAVPFSPFTLHPGESVAIGLKVVAGQCSAGDAVSMTAISVTWSLAWRKETTELPLPYPIKRVCPDGQLKPQLVEPPVVVDDGWQPTDYDFAAPPGWTATPLRNFGGPAKLAYWRQPGGKGTVTYERNGGMAGMLYAHSDHPGAAEAKALIECPLTSFRDLQGGPAYTCVTVKGLLRQGFLRVFDAPRGFERIEIATSDRAIFAAFPDHVKA